MPVLKVFRYLSNGDRDALLRSLLRPKIINRSHRSLTWGPPIWRRIDGIGDTHREGVSCEAFNTCSSVGDRQSSGRTSTSTRLTDANDVDWYVAVSCSSRLADDLWTLASHCTACLPRASAVAINWPKQSAFSIFTRNNYYWRRWHWDNVCMWQRVWVDCRRAHDEEPLPSPVGYINTGDVKGSLCRRRSTAAPICISRECTVLLVTCPEARHGIAYLFDSAAKHQPTNQPFNQSVTFSKKR